MHNERFILKKDLDQAEMHSNQTIQLKPAYQHSHISLYNAPIIGNAVSGFSIAPDVHIITTNGASICNDQDISNFNTLTTIQGIPTSVTASNNGTTRIVHPVSANSVCLNNIPIQQLQMHQSSGQLLQTKFNATQQKAGQILQVQLTAPQIAPPASVAMIDMGSGANGQNTNHVASRSNLTSSSNFQDGPSSSRSSSSTSEANYNEAISSDSSKGLNSRAKVLVNSQSNRARSGNVSYLTQDQSGSSYGSNNATKMELDSCNDEHAINLRSTARSKGFKCQICNRDFTQKGNLKTHLMTHSGERPYECQTCGKNFTQKGNLDTHVKIHTETKDHRCQYCDRGFTQRGNLKTHIRSVHTKEKPYSCNHCGKCFSQKGNMLTHFRTHDKEARFPCNVCGKTFSQKGNLRTHQQRHDRGR